MFSAKALFNNIAESRDELSFSKGDILEVIEKETNGWWLCSFQGKIGIAPGNRLQPLPSAPLTRFASPSGRNSPSLSLTLNCTEKPYSGSNIHCSKKSGSDFKDRPSWHISDKVVIPKKLGNVFVYESKNHIHQDYDVPPSHHNGLIRDVSLVATSEQNDKSSLTRISDALQSYDVPSALRSPVETNPVPSNNYDRLPALTGNLSQLPDSMIPKASTAITYDIPLNHTACGSDLDATLVCNRLSTLSVLSTGSRSSACSGHSSLSSTMSVRSSLDASLQDFYDVPPCSQLDSISHLYPITEQGMLSKSNGSLKANLKHCIQPSVTSSCAVKDLVRQSATDSPSNIKLHVDRDSYLEDYSVPKCDVSQGCNIPKSDISQGFGDSGVSMSQVESFSSRCCSNEIYDTPRKLTDAELQGNCNMQDQEENKYDVPQQLIQNFYTESTSKEMFGMYSCVDAIHSSFHVGDSINKLNSLQSNVLSYGSKLIGFINKGSRQQELSQIKHTCLALKTAVKEVIEFGNFFLSHIMTSPNCKELSDKILQLLEKVHVQFLYLNRHTERLITSQWPTEHVGCDGGEISELDDNLNTIEMLVETISSHLLALTRFIMQNASVIGETPEVFNYDCASSGDIKSLNNESSCKSSLSFKESISKACTDSIERQSFVQNRPLPPVPLQDSNNFKFHASKSAVHGINPATSNITSLQRSNLSEWSDECDYVSIANEAENEMKAQEKLLVRQSSVKSVSDSCSEALETDKTITQRSTVFGLLAENNCSKLEPIDMFKNVTEISGLTNSLSCPGDDPRIEGGSAVFLGSDQQLLTYYIEQIETNFTVVDTAVREFFQMMFSDCVTAKEFLLRSKFVILAAHKLVYIGDTITRNSIHSSAPPSDIAQRANRLCNILKETVAVTKTSALNFPQSLAQQQLTECMKAVLQTSRLLCAAILVNFS